jgi:hypothetical protein
VDAVGSLPRSDRWQTQARSRCATSPARRSRFTDDVLCAGRSRLARQAGPRSPHHGDVQEIRRADTMGSPRCSVALRQLRNLR